MDAMSGTGPVPAPTHKPGEFLAYEAECRNALQPQLAALLDAAEAAGWRRRTAASTLMFLAAQQVSATAGAKG
ncbi:MULTISPECIES: hypothetical protein [unclassified Mesorhizobium]|uniref:hypothetical protein n=1 Tax=unclassified Mesorhizobium TaxID=325217 RepID=UPI0024172418|nr:MULTISPECIES: hypothetical protein [unclassified Mesorhizobium]WFP61772.1 hypothetical protein QAZ47_25355 [Mesorhizobium sp. WSM4904]WFP75047.1 hypothetical protein QAZ22_25480 [Mesorhizobium sp. WSM4906]